MAYSLLSEYLRVLRFLERCKSLQRITSFRKVHKTAGLEMCKWICSKALWELGSKTNGKQDSKEGPKRLGEYRDNKQTNKLEYNGKLLNIQNDLSTVVYNSWLIYYYWSTNNTLQIKERAYRCRIGCSSSFCLCIGQTTTFNPVVRRKGRSYNTSIILDDTRTLFLSAPIHTCCWSHFVAVVPSLQLAVIVKTFLLSLILPDYRHFWSSNPIALPYRFWQFL